MRSTSRTSRSSIRQPLGGRGVLAALVAALDVAEGVEGEHDRDAERAGCLQGGEAGHPEVRVHHVGPLGLPLAAEVRGELAHVGQQLVLAHRPGWAGVDLVDGDVRVEHGAPRGGHVVPTGVDDGVHALPGHC